MEVPALRIANIQILVWKILEVSLPIISLKLGMILPWTPKKNISRVSTQALVGPYLWQAIYLISSQIMVDEKLKKIGRITHLSRYKSFMYLSPVI